MRYLTEDGELLTGDSPLEIVEALRDGSKFAFNQHTSQFMEGYAERVYNLDSNTIRTDSPSFFLQDLVLFGYLKSV
jgi:hypothetical protein